MSKMNQLLLSGQTIWTLDDMSAIWGQRRRTDTSQSSKQLARAGKLLRLRRGIYALPDIDLDPSAIAGKLVVPSYLTGESVLHRHGVSFQLSNRLTSASLVSRKIKLGGTEFIYYRLNQLIFYNPLGVDGDQASLERAVGDLIYIFGGRYQFEDLSAVDWSKLRAIGAIYQKKSVLDNISKLEELYA